MNRHHHSGGAFFVPCGVDVDPINMSVIFGGETSEGCVSSGETMAMAIAAASRVGRIH